MAGAGGVGVVELCQDSPIDRIASGQKLADLSLARNGRLPIMWQIELTDQVTWCRKLTRTRPAQKNAVTAPHQDQVITPPSAAGRPRLIPIHSGKSRSMSR